MSTPHSLEATIERMSRLPLLQIGQWVSEKGRQAVIPAHEFKGIDLARELAIDDRQLSHAVTAISVQIAQWGRLAAMARRNWQFAERNFRIWRDGIVLKASADTGQPGWKKPTEKQIEATYRSEAAYMRHQTALEASEEAYNAALAVLDGFRAKKDMLRANVIRNAEESSPRLSI